MEKQDITINDSYCTPANAANALSKTICVKKVNESFLNLSILGILAGVYVGFGACLATLVGHDAEKYIGVGLTKFMVGGVFSVGIMLVVIAGAELFTGNNLMLMSVLDKQSPLGKMLSKWAIVYVANLVGSVLLAFIYYKTNLWKIGDLGVGISALKIANVKVNLTFGEAFARGILCNWLVCLAVWMAITSREVVGKILAIFFPIMAFVASGFEHCVANMYFIPTGLFLKGTQVAAVSGLNLDNLNHMGFLLNLIPVTLGNIIGGAFFVGCAYWTVYVKKL